ncbi:methyl-coenzyme M reductase operon protein D [Methanobrevibacter sp. 87.7]|uniref:methyl-coenzyme M reductase operon protein D n=1 Tax=Methanobrevibacter sp. 87.7 TaxID=387957 RepID=UPI000B50B165|nr:methyl-coenzyme M reductase operon protein D [Methanobrevibacter sp. 87.7]OWT33388.1 methyl-coenzyme M reductase operon protein D [Methanobrevibacter sp. 87.7]
MDIEIFPYRFLSADTTEKMLNGIESLDDVKRAVIHGPRLPPDDPDLLPQYKERRNITVCGKPIELKVRTGRILVELSSEAALDEIEKICDENLKFGYDINTSRSEYIRRHKTVSDAIKYGTGENNLPDELIGLTDNNKQFADSVDFIDYDKVE